MRVILQGNLLQLTQSAAVSVTLCHREFNTVPCNALYERQILIKQASVAMWGSKQKLDLDQND